MTSHTSHHGRVADWRQGWILVLAGFLPVMAVVALAPTLPTLMAHFKDVPNAMVMVPLLLTAPSACIALLAPAAGYFIDRFGRRKLMLVSMLSYSLGGIVPFLVDSFWAVAGGRLLIGVAEAGILTVTNTLLADYFEEAERHRWLMIQGITIAVLGSVVIGCSGFLAAIGWQWPFAVYALAFPIFLAAVFHLYEPAPRNKPTPAPNMAASAAELFPWRATFWLCAATAGMSIIYFVQPIHFSLILKGFGIDNPKTIGLIMTLPSIGVPLGAILFKYTTRFGPIGQLRMVLGFYAVGLTGVGLAPDFKIALGFVFFQQLANGVTVPALIAWAQSRFNFDQRGRGMGLWACAFFAAQFSSPALVGLARGQLGGLQQAFVAFGLLSALGVLLAAWAVRPQTTSLSSQGPLA
jgi:MFS family permease